MANTGKRWSDFQILMIHIVIALLVLVLDQICKWIVLTTMEPFNPVAITGFFNLILVFNKGAAFGFLADSELDANRIFLYSNIAILFLLFYTLWLLRPGRSQSVTGIWLILGGALGNIVDRIVHGHVVDFLDFHYGGWHYSTFNIADACISVGAVLIVLEFFNIKVFFRPGKNQV